MARTYFSRATHAIIGVDHDGACGVLHWHDNELDAWRDMHAMRRKGACCIVVSAPEGELSPKDQCRVKEMIDKALGLTSR